MCHYLVAVRAQRKALRARLRPAEARSSSGDATVPSLSGARDSIKHPRARRGGARARRRPVEAFVPLRSSSSAVARRRRDTSIDRSSSSSSFSSSSSSSASASVSSSASSLLLAPPRSSSFAPPRATHARVTRQALNPSSHHTITPSHRIVDSDCSTARCLVEERRVERSTLQLQLQLHLDLHLRDYLIEPVIVIGPSKFWTCTRHGSASSPKDLVCSSSQRHNK